MADKKISALTGATTPLAGTEVVPLVQSSTTKNVSIDNLTAGRSVSASGLTLSGLTASSAVATNGSKALVSVTNTGTGNNVLSATPAFTGTPTFTNSSASQATFVGWSWTNGANGASGSFALGGTAAYRGQIGYAADGDTTMSFDNTYDSANAKMQFRMRTAGSPVTALSMLGSGNVTVDVGNLIVGTAGKGIDFSANTHAAGMTSELLDWYEEGTWTPAYAPATGAFDSVTYDTAVTGGKYTRIGNMVHVQGGIRTDAITVGTASGQVYITGLPFAAASNTNGQDGWSTLTIGQATAWLGDVPSVGSIVAGQSRFELQYRTAANGATIDLAVTDMDTGADKNLMRFSATYIAA